MAMNRKFVAVLSTAAFTAMLLGQTAFAATGDVYDLTTKQVKYLASEYATNASKFLQFKQDMILHRANLGYEYNDKVIKGTDLLAKTTNTVADFNTYLTQLDNDNTVTKLPVSDFTQAGTLKVESVSAINATTIRVTFEGIANPVDVTLDTPLVNGAAKVTFTYDGKTYSDVALAEAYVDPAAAVKARTVQFISNSVIKINDNVYTFTDTSELTSVTDGVESTDFGGAAINAAINAGDLVDVTVSGQNVVKVKVDLTENAKANLTKAIADAKALIAAERTKATSVSADDTTALAGTVVSDYVAATAVGSAYDLAIQAAEAANTATANKSALDTATAALATATGTFNTAKTAFDTAVTALATARTDLATAIADAKTLIAAERAKVAAVNADDRTALSTAFTNYQTATAEGSTYDSAIQAAEAANTATATATVLGTAKSNLDTATGTFNTAKTAFDTAVTALATARTDLATAIANAKTLVAAERAKVAAVSANDITALGTDFTDYQTAVSPGQAYDVAITTAEAANTATAATTALTSAKSALDTATGTFNTAKTAFDTAVTALATARTDLATAIANANTLYNAQKSRVDTFTISEVTMINAVVETPSDINAYDVYVTAVGAYKTAIQSATDANTATATATALGTAKSNLDTATGIFNTAKTAFDGNSAVVSIGK